MSALVDDPEARLEYLLECGVLEERGDGSIVVGDSFHAELEVYEDSYLDVSEEQFAATVGSVFGLDQADAAERIEATGMTRRELATFLALRAHLDDSERTRDELALMAGMVADVGPASPVPEGMTEVTDETFEAYIEEHGDVVAFVFQRHCVPCEAMKEELPELLSAVPDHVAVAGVDGDEAVEFRRANRVGVAPTTLLFEGGDLVVTLEGRKPVDDLVGAVESVYSG